MTVLEVSGLRVAVAGKEILTGVDLRVAGGEVHAVMGPNGSGKSTLSHVIMGRPGYQVLEGRVTLDGEDLLAMPTWRRAQAGLFLALQYPTEVPGVRLGDVLAESFRESGRDTAGLHDAVAAEAAAVGFGPELLDRALNVDLSGGEKKRAETIQLGVLRPRIAVLDELDSGLDIDALRACARRIERATHETGLGVLAITHYRRLFTELHPDVVHVLVGGRIVETGGPELADRLEAGGYATYDGGAAAAEPAPPGEDPFADPLA